MKFFMGLVCTVAMSLAACGDNEPPSANVTVTAEPAGSNCAAGGQRIDVTVDGNTSTSYVCNGSSSVATVTVATEPAGSNCAAGGVAITSSSGGSTVTSYVCNGAAIGVSAVAEGSGSNCADGGIKLTDSNGSASYVCNGTPGTSVTVGQATSGECATGGAVVSVGSATAVDVCNGTDGSGVTLGSAGADCGSAGGISVTVGSGSAVDVCNGAAGSAGQSVSIGSGGAGCTTGGIAVTEGATTSYVCNGASVSVTAVGSGASSPCVYGGEAFAVGSDTSYACNGAPGSPGSQGSAGNSVSLGSAGTNCPTPNGVSLTVGGNTEYVCNGASVTTTPFTGSDGGLAASCSTGGVELQVGSAAAQFVCNGAAGANGTSVTLGSAGSNCATPNGVSLTVGANTEYVCNGSELIWSTIGDGSDQTLAPEHGYISQSTPDVTVTLPTAASLGDEIKVLVPGAGSVHFDLDGNTIGYGGGLSGPPWTAVTNPQAQVQSSILTSDDGTVIALGEADGVVVSTDSGSSWNTVAPAVLGGYFSQSAAMAGDGTLYLLEQDTGTIYYGPPSGADWQASNLTGRGNWTSVAASGASVIVAGPNDVVVSSTGGSGFASVEAALESAGLGSDASIAGVGISADGSHLAVTATTTVNLCPPDFCLNQTSATYLSTDGGATFMAESGADCTAFAYATDGSQLVALCNGELDEFTTSAETGSPNQLQVVPGGNGVEAFASSSDGATLYAASQGTSTVYVSRDHGATWSTTAAQVQPWQALATSADGTIVYGYDAQDTNLYRSQAAGMIAHHGAALDLTFVGGGEWFVTSVNGLVEQP